MGTINPSSSSGTGDTTDLETNLKKIVESIVGDIPDGEVDDKLMEILFPDVMSQEDKNNFNEEILALAKALALKSGEDKEIIDKMTVETTEPEFLEKYGLEFVESTGTSTEARGKFLD